MSPRLLSLLCAILTLQTTWAQASSPCPETLREVLLLEGPAQCTCQAPSTEAAVWGDAIYHPDSNLCAAALHAGAISKEGGDLLVDVMEGCASYQGTPSNGVISQDGGHSGQSFFFPGARTGSCELSTGVGVQATVLGQKIPPCPSDLQARRGNPLDLLCVCEGVNLEAMVWGTDTYTDDSSLCTAALHASVIPKAGGEVLVRSSAGCRAYEGSARNGVKSALYPRFGGSFFFPDSSDGACPE